MSEPLTADEIRSLLKLEPNATCGFVRETYTSKLSIAPGGLPAPFANGRRPDVTVKASPASTSSAIAC